jgi:hypothetical protein
MFPPVQPRRQRRLNRSVVAGALALVVALVLLIGLVVMLNRPPAVTKPTILIDTEGPAQTLIPDGEAIARAQHALGSKFIAYITCNQTSE